MPANRKLSPRQMELLIDFMENRPEVALGRFQGPQASQAARQAWNSIASTLNSVAEGTTKTPDQWRRYWIELKARTKTKAADSRRNISKTGGGPNKFAPLNSNEERVISIIGQVAVVRLPEVRIPVNIPTEEENTALDCTSCSSTSIPPSIPSERIEVQVEVEMERQDNVFPLPSLQSPSLHHPISSQSPSLHHPISSQSPSLLPNLVQRDDTREDRHSQSSPNLSSRQRPRITRPIRRDRNLPRWVYDLEARRIAAKDEKNLILKENLKIKIEKLNELKESRKVELEKLSELKQIRLALQELNNIMTKND